MAFLTDDVRIRALLNSTPARSPGRRQDLRHCCAMKSVERLALVRGLEFPPNLPRVRCSAVEPDRCDRAWRNGIDANAGGGPFARSTFAQRMHAAPRGAGMRIIRPAVPDVCDDVDDGAAIALHPAGIDLTHENEAAGEI